MGQGAEGASGGEADAAAACTGEPEAAAKRRKMSKRLLSRVLGMFQSRTQVGVDKAGNRYFTRVEEVDGGSTCPGPIHHHFPAFTFSLDSSNGHLLLISSGRRIAHGC